MNTTPPRWTEADQLLSWVRAEGGEDLAAGVLAVATRLYASTPDRDRIAVALADVLRVELDAALAQRIGSTAAVRAELAVESARYERAVAAQEHTVASADDARRKADAERVAHTEALVARELGL